jgi:nitrile hydratase accessory protein
LNESDALGPLARKDYGPVFDEGWQAQVLALAFNLVDRGQFTSAEWSQALGAELVRASERGDADDSETYYKAVLTALEQLLHSQDSLPSQMVDQRTEAWRAAYFNTPHGQPVKLAD